MQWTVSTMERTLNDSESGLEGVVNILHWQVADSDGDHSGRCYGTVGLEAPDADSFTAYADISHDDAVEWAKSALGEEAVSQYEDSVASQIELSKNPVQASGTPWT
tara:strand:+ start:908 stop:1225 length:318 start_codon:yes stop_codon:yes gene_type:complete